MRPPGGDCRACQAGDALKPDPLRLVPRGACPRLPPLRHDEAVDVYKQAIALAPNQIAAHLGLTICYAQAGQSELARIQGREILRVAPKFDMALYAKSLTYQDPEDSRRSLDALAKAFAPAAVIRTAAG